NIAGEDCKQVILDNLEDVQEIWEKYSKMRLKKLVATVHDLLKPMEVCDAWYPDPDEWKSTWACKDSEDIIFSPYVTRADMV
ncbi:hypothetical protein FRC11_001347, partial [Ceratobasidium sp. 423]